ncbi:hypothetical protein C8J57DRAFT_1727789 [Mycena rebaudengoi]|nr:hypothetical protein C8J57DRAFT_1727789 [Mycena rebaudengoi]
MSFNEDIVLGALLVGTWANSVLYTIEIIQAVYFYRNFKHDNWMLKLLVSSAIAIDSVSMFANYASVYLVTQSHTGEIWRIYKTSIGKFDPLYLFATGIVAALVQSFLAARYWLLTRNKFISFTLFFLITVAAGGAFACGVTLTIYPEYKNRRKAIIPATTWLIAEAVTDTFICVGSSVGIPESQVLVQGDPEASLLTGTAGASIALAVLVAFLANKESNGRVYCLTMLANLNVRKTGDTWLSKGTISGARTETRGERGNQVVTEGDHEYGGIHVRRTVVHIDTPQELSISSFKTNPDQGLPGEGPTGEIEMTVNDSASYYSKKKQDLFAA